MSTSEFVLFSRGAEEIRCDMALDPLELDIEGPTRTLSPCHAGSACVPPSIPAQSQSAAADGLDWTSAVLDPSATETNTLNSENGKHWETM